MLRTVNTLAVLSGKGGVGKTTVSCSLARSLAKHEKRVGLLDVDIHGPNVPTAMGMQDRTLNTPEIIRQIDRTRKIPPFVQDGIKVLSLAFAFPKDTPFLWQGQFKREIIRWFVTDGDWGELDYLVVDTPPGTSEEVQEILTYLKPKAAVGVTTPSELAKEDFLRIRMLLKEKNVPLVLTVLNMKGFTCPKCGEVVEIFGNGQVEDGMVAVPIDPQIASTRNIPNFDGAVEGIIKRMEA